MLTKNNDIKNLLKWYYRSGERSEEPQTCPDEEVFYDFLMEKLPDNLRNELELHLLTCDRCRHTLFEVSALLEEDYLPCESEVPDPVAERILSRIPEKKIAFTGLLWEKVIEKINSFYNNFMDIFFSREREFVYVRGSRKVISENLIVLEKVFKAIKLQIEIEKVRNNASDIKVITKDPATGAPFDGVRLGLLNTKREVASYMAVKGETLFENMPFGWYKLTARKDDKNLGEVILRIKE